MSDFGKIFDQWESRSTESRRSKPSRSSPGSSPHADNADPAMNQEWIDKYPPQPEDLDEFRSTPSKKIRADRLPIDGQIDLHGYRLEEAAKVTTEFLEESLGLGRRKILIIHGKGDNGNGVLRREIRQLLEQHPRTGEMGYGKGNEGGRGALWVMLRGGQHKV